MKDITKIYKMGIIQIIRNTLVLSVFLFIVSFTTNAQNTVESIRHHLKNPSDDYVLVVAHRGDWRNAPENSIRAVSNVIRMGVDIVEIDVHKTKDNEIIVMHDKRIDRTTTGKGAIAELKLDSIQKVFLRNGAGISTKYKVPTLRELMLYVKGKPIMVNIDKAWENFHLVMKVVEETATMSQVILKGNTPIHELRKQYGNLIDKVIYMPMVWPEDYGIYKRENFDSPYEYTLNFIKEYRPLAFEVILKDEKSSVDKAIQLIRKEHISIWINTLWAELCANHEDDKAIDNPDEHWGWVIRKGANIIQTDYPTQLLEYLRKNNLHQ